MGPIHKNKFETELEESAAGTLVEVGDELVGLKNEPKRA